MSIKMNEEFESAITRQQTTLAKESLQISLMPNGATQLKNGDMGGRLYATE